MMKHVVIMCVVNIISLSAEIIVIFSKLAADFIIGFVQFKAVIQGQVLVPFIHKITAKFGGIVITVDSNSAQVKFFVKIIHGKRGFHRPFLRK